MAHLRSTRRVHYFDQSPRTRRAGNAGRSVGRLIRRAFFVSFLGLLFVLALGSAAQAAPPQPAIWTDKADYHPGEVVTIYGVEFRHNKTIDMSVTRPDAAVDVWTTLSNSTGSFVTTYQLNGIHGNYTVEATDGRRTATTTFTDSAVNIDQCTNGGVGDTPEPCKGSTGSAVGGFKNWVNGNANGQKAHWREGEFISYRATVTGVSAAEHTLRIQYDTVHGSKHAIDYIGSFDATETTGSATSFNANQNDPCADVLPSSECDPSNPVDTEPIDSAILIDCGGSSSSGSVTQISGDIAIWGPSGTTLGDMSYFAQNVVSGTGKCSTTVDIKFTPGSASSTVVIAWGGHIASEADWGDGNSASFISGSPYHMRLVSLDGQSTGAQDRALSTSAVVFTPTISTAILRDADDVEVTFGTVPIGTTIRDTATLTDASSNAGGTVTYERFDNGDCSGDPVATEDVTVTNRVVLDSSTFTPASAGSISYRAVYGGDSKNLPAASACEPLQVDKIPSQTVTNIHDANDNVVTVIDAADTVHDQATVSGSGPTPTGTVTFRWFEVGNCGGTPFDTSSASALSGGAVDATSFTQTPLDATKSYSFQAIYSGDNTYLGSASACEPLTVVDAFVTIASSDTNGITEPHAFVVHIESASGSAFQAVQGVFPSISFSGGTPGYVDTSDCDDGTDAFGNCVVIINSNVAATFTAHAAVTLTVGGVSLTRDTDLLTTSVPAGPGGSLGSGGAVKTYVAGSLSWTKEDESGVLLGGATFEVCLTEVFQTFTSTFVDVVDSCFDVTDDVAPDEDPLPGKFLLTGLVLGRYTVQETVAPPGFVLDPDLVQAPDMTLDPSEVEITVAFVNTAPFESCTPGFWKNHPDTWDLTEFETDDEFNEVFGVTEAWSGLDEETLRQALAVSGGELMALNRHAVAALLNADALAYPLTVEEVIALYQDAVGLGGVSIADAHAILAGHNEEFECTLGGEPANPLGPLLTAISSSLSSVSQNPVSWILGLLLSALAGILIAYRRRRH